MLVLFHCSKKGMMAFFCFKSCGSYISICFKKGGREGKSRQSLLSTGTSNFNFFLDLENILENRLQLLEAFGLEKISPTGRISTGENLTYWENLNWRILTTWRILENLNNLENLNFLKKLGESQQLGETQFST